MKNSIKILVSIILLTSLVSLVLNSCKENSLVESSEISKEEKFENLFFDLEEKIENEDQYFFNYSEAFNFVNLTSVTNDLSNEERCKMAFKVYKQTKCKVKRKKWAKQLVKKIGSANISYKDGKITTPGITIFRNEVNRLNVLVEIFYNQQLEICNKLEVCKGVDFAVICIHPIPEVVKDRYRECTEILKRDSTNSLLIGLGKIADNLHLFGQGIITAEMAKAIIGNENEKMEKEVNKSREKESNSQ